MRPPGEFSRANFEEDSTIVLRNDVDYKARSPVYYTFSELRRCDSRGRRPGLPVPNSPYGLCGRKPTLNLKRERERDRLNLRERKRERERSLA